MTETLKPELGPVQETLLIPLLARAVETKRPRGLLRDPKAVEIVETLDYDFTKWQGGPSLMGACLRTRMLDEEVEAFLKRHPHGTVVELGCGLNTRFERLDNGTARWFDLDLPDAIALRRRFFADSERRSMIAASVLDDGWTDTVAETSGPYCFVSEAVLIYLDEQDVKRVVSALAQRFPGAVLLMDTTGSAMVDGQARHDAMRHLPPSSWFRWRCDDPRMVESWANGISLVKTSTFLDASPEVRKALPRPFALLMRFAPWLLRRKVSSYRLNVYRLGRRTSFAPD